VRAGIRGSVLLVGLLAVVVAGAARAGTAKSVGVRTPFAAIQELNAEREANGIPGGIVENATWSARCLDHARWMRRNRLVQHAETPGTPLYTPAGNWAAARAVLSGGDPWTTLRNPFETAPMHLAQLLAPQLRRMGVGIYRGWACATTLPGYGHGRARRNVVYAYPSGRSPVRWREHAREYPFTPQRFVGIDESQPTGPYLLVFADGPWLHSGPPPTIRAATLRGAEGEVEVRFVDGSSPDLAPYLPRGSGMLIPVHPLRRGASYAASVTLANARHRVTRTWTFVTRR
jgi:hypothetical protein